MREALDLIKVRYIYSFFMIGVGTIFKKHLFFIFDSMQYPQYPPTPSPKVQAKHTRYFLKLSAVIIIIGVGLLAIWQGVQLLPKGGEELTEQKCLELMSKFASVEDLVFQEDILNGKTVKTAYPAGYTTINITMHNSTHAESCSYSALSDVSIEKILDRNADKYSCTYGDFVQTRKFIISETTSLILIASERDIPKSYTLPNTTLVIETGLPSFVQSITYANPSNRASFQNEIEKLRGKTCD